MKKTLTTLGLLMGMALSAAAGTPTIAPTPVVASNTCEKQAIELEMLLAIADNDSLANMWGPRISYNIYKDGCASFCHQFNVRLATLWGD